MGLYTQLTQEQRYQIYAFLKAGFSQSAIASEINVHKSTICRELKRNKGQKGYRPKQAHVKATNRRQKAVKYVKLTPKFIILVNNLIRQDFSPEQVSGTLKRNHGLMISHETIYKHLLVDKANGGNLYKHLRRSNRKRKKRYGSRNLRGQITGRVSIDLRPTIVDNKERIGDWEIDTLIGKNHKGVLLTIVERKSKYTLIQRLSYKRSQLVADATINLLTPYREKVFTITSDNGKEFAEHQRISKRLTAKMYFAHPYHSWERGLNENTNGLIRQYFPKNTNFKTITIKSVQKVMDRLNNRPRKTLGYATPNEVFFGKSFKHAA
jgi:IS30 family transposase